MRLTLLNIVCLHPVITCPPLTVMNHASVDSTAVAYGSEVTLSCDEGYELEDDVTDVTLECLRTGNWTRDLTNLSCSSMPS